MKKIFILMVATLLLFTMLLTTSCANGGYTGETVPTATVTQPDFFDETGIGYLIQEDGTLQVTVSGNYNEVTVPSEYNGMTVTSIGKSTFKHTSVTSIVLPDTITSIGTHAFSFCNTLEIINIPEGVESIGTNAFTYCLALKEIQLPSTLKTIGKYAFDACGLTQIEVPDNVELIDDFAFAECSNLRTVTILGKKTELGNKVFDDIQDLTIKAKKNSNAHKYAKNNGINFVAI